MDEKNGLVVPQNNEKKAPNVKIGDYVQIKRGPKKGTRGKVVVVRENSVIIEIGKNRKTNEPIRTVVNHKNYKRVR